VPSLGEHPRTLSLTPALRQERKGRGPGIELLMSRSRQAQLVGLILIGLTAMMSGCGDAPVVSASGAQFADDYVQLRAPKGWVDITRDFSKSEGGLADTAFSDPGESDEPYAYFSMYHEGAGPNFSLKESVASDRAAGEEDPDVEVLEQRDTKLGGAPAVRVEFRNRSEKADITGWTVTALHRNRVAYLSLIGSTEGWDSEWKDAFASVIATWRWRE
jgi:hypothetical protein